VSDVERRLIVRIMMDSDQLRLEVYREVLRAIVANAPEEPWRGESEECALARKALELFGDAP